MVDRVRSDDGVEEARGYRKCGTEFAILSERAMVSKRAWTSIERGLWKAGRCHVAATE